MHTPSFEKVRTRARAPRAPRPTSPRARFTRKKGAFSADRLKQEVAAPYKNNVIGAVVLGFGVVAAASVAAVSWLPGLQPRWS